METVKLVDLTAPFGEGVQHLKLTVEKGTGELTENVGGAEIHPCIFINLAAEKLSPICTLVPNNLGSFNHLRTINAQSATFTANIVFGFMEAVRAEMADRAQGSVLIEGIHALSSIFNDQQVVFFGNSHDAVHVA